MAQSEIGEAIKKLRQALGGISQERFARKLGVTVRTAARWEAAESLSAPILSRLRGIAQAANAREIAEFFEERIRESLDFQEDDFFLEQIALTPGSEDEKDLVAELLERYRNEDPKIEPIVEQLRALMTETYQRIEREVKETTSLRDRRMIGDAIRAAIKPDMPEEKRKKK